MLAPANRADPCGRLGSPREIAETVAFLMPAESRVSPVSTSPSPAAAVRRPDGGAVGRTARRSCPCPARSRPSGPEIAGRFTLVPSRPFPCRGEWKGLVAGMEDTLRLHDHRPGTLTGLGRFLRDRTGGMIGSLSRAIRGAAIDVILTDAEKVTKKIPGGGSFAGTAGVHGRVRCTAGPVRCGATPGDGRRGGSGCRRDGLGGHARGRPRARPPSAPRRHPPYHRQRLAHCPRDVRHREARLAHHAFAVHHQHRPLQPQCLPGAEHW